MWKDPIVEETRNLREEYANHLNDNIEAIFEDIQKRQAQPNKKLEVFPARKPLEILKVA